MQRSVLKWSFATMFDMWGYNMQRKSVLFLIVLIFAVLAGVLMTQGSMPWNDQGGGDGNPGANHFESPYNAAEWHGLWNVVLGGNSGTVYVIAGMGSNYAVTQRGAGANMSVDVAAGEALVNGARAKSDATENVSIDAADATNPRIDRVVLQYIPGTTQTIRVAVIKGTAAASPSLPALTQTTSLYEVDLAHIYVRAAITTITTADISDKRVFAPNLSRPQLYEILNTNSEFMAFGKLSAGTASPGAPDAWDIVGTVTTWASSTKPAQMSRGRAVSITAGAATSGMSQTIQVKPSTTYAIKTLIKVTAGDVGNFKVTTNSASPGTITREIRRTATWLEETIYYTTESDASTLTVSLLAASNTDIIEVGQTFIVEGFVPGGYREVRESIALNASITDANWNGTGKSTGNTTIDLDTDFQGLILPGTRSVRILITAADTGTPLNPGQILLRTVASASTLANVSSNGLPSGASDTGEGTAPIDVNHQFVVAVTASGVNTCLSTLRIVGIDI